MFSLSTWNWCTPQNPPGIVPNVPQVAFSWRRPFLPIRSVGVMGDARTYENTIAVRCVTSRDAMTGDWAQLPHALLGRISNRIINEVAGENRVVYAISSKPPATNEWE